MIYTVTLNPSIDYLIRLEHLQIGQINRMESTESFPGGKGINAARMLQRLGFSSIAMGFLGGYSGAFIEQKLEAEKVQMDFITIRNDTRINVKIKGDVETEINAPGPDISQDEKAIFLDKLRNVTKNDIVIFAGSAPIVLGQDIYEQLIRIVREQGAEIVCDFEGKTLIDALRYQPLLVKPNKQELGQMYNLTLQSYDDILDCAERLRNSGAQNVIVSLAGEGALLICEKGRYFAEPIKGTVKNSVGAGDSMVAGFTGIFAKTNDYLEAFKQGVACGTATAFSDDLATPDSIAEILAKVKIEKI